MRISKVKKYILIPVICLILSVIISFVSLAEDTLIPLQSLAFTGTTNIYTTKNSTTKPSWYSNNNYHVDLAGNADDIYRYVYYRTSKSSGSYALMTAQWRFYAGGFNTFSTNFLFPQLDGYNSLLIQFLDVNNATIRQYTLAFSQPSGVVEDDDYSFAYRQTITTVSLNQIDINVQYISLSNFYGNLSGVSSIQITQYCYSVVSSTDFIEFIYPIFNVYGQTSGSESEWESSVSDSLDEMSGKLDDVVSGIGGLNDEVSHLGDDISQGFAGLNSAEESRHNEIMGDDYSTDESAIDNMGLQVSELDDNFSDHDIDISNGIDNLNSFDESDLFDDIESAFNDLDNAAGHNDMHYTGFVQQLYSTLGIGTYLLFLVPFCMIFVLFKFVIGGVV